jgi:hypothetical protein
MAIDKAFLPPDLWAQGRNREEGRKRRKVGKRRGEGNGRE